MKNPYSFLVLLVASIALLPTALRAQSTNVNAYTTVASSSTYASTSITLAAATPDNVAADGIDAYDDGWYNNKPIGFTFQFRGVNYTTISASTNGWLTFGRALSSSALSNNIATGGLAGFPLVAPLWDDLSLIDGAGNFYFETTGTAPNRVFTAEWYEAAWNFNAGQGVISFEVKLYENTNAIQFAYHRIGGNNNLNAASASIGLAGGAGEYSSVGGTAAAPTFSTSVATNDIDEKPVNNRVFTFTPARVLYDFAARNAPYVPLTTSAATLSAGNLNNGYYNGIAIGFPFQFRGVAYSTISASTNGWLTFNQSLTDDGLDNNLGGTADGAALPTVLAPLWDNLSLATGGFRTSVTGTTPNRVFTAEWYNAEWQNTASAASLSFQVKLFEGSNRVWYLYAPTANALSNPSASIGFNDGGYFRSLSGTGAAPTASTTTATDNLNTKPATGQVYAFAPAGTVGGPLPVELVEFSAKRSAATAVVLSWRTASEKDNAGFAVEKSADGREYQQLAFVAGAGSSTAAHTYSHVDNAAPAAAYYRLRQLDHDGQASYSPTQFVPAATGKAEGLALYPNPARSIVQVLNADPDASLTLCDALGRPVRTYTASAAPLDLAGLAAGVYWLRTATQHVRLVVE